MDKPILDALNHAAAGLPMFHIIPAIPEPPKDVLTYIDLMQIGSMIGTKTEHPDGSATYTYVASPIQPFPDEGESPIRFPDGVERIARWQKIG